MRTPLILVAIASALLAACSSTPPTRNTYLLRSDSNLESGPLAKAGNYYLGEVEVANYIDHSGLVLELSDGKVHTAKHHHWAEPLRTSLREFLSAEIAAETGRTLASSSSSSLTRIDVSISQLHGDAEGNAVLVAQWSLSSDNTVSKHQFSKSLALEKTGYEALVAAETALFTQLAQAIASELK